MLLRYLLDEHLRGALWQAIQSHNAQGVYPVDVVRIGDLPGLPLGTVDSDILGWAERDGRIVVSRDENTLKTHLADHLQAGHHSPGLFLVRKGSKFADVVFFLVAAAYASDPVEWEDQYNYIP